MADRLLNKIFQGEVAVVHNYGAFVRIPGAGRTQGLVHKSQISASRVDDATEVLEANERIWCKVISVHEDGKIALSMKVVDQGSGRDLDPNGVQISLDDQQRKERVGRGEAAPISLEAVLKTTCSKCKVSGHLASNCFQTPGGRVYDLIPEPEPEIKIFGTANDRLKRLAEAGIVETTGNTTEESSSKRLKKKKKNSKENKRRKRSSSSSDSSVAEKRNKKKRKSSSDGDEVREKRSKRENSDRSMKKRKNERSSSSSDSSDSDEAERKKHRKRREKTKRDSLKKEKLRNNYSSSDSDRGKRKKAKDRHKKRR